MRRWTCETSSALTFRSPELELAAAWRVRSWPLPSLLRAALARSGCPPTELGEAIRQLRGAAPDHSVAVNLLMPFLRRSHVDVCIESRIDVAVIAFVMDWAMQRWLTEHGVSGRTHRG